MPKDAAFSATFEDFKLIKTRSSVQIVLEVPIEQADAALKALGGLPVPGSTVHVAVALMSNPAQSEGNAMQETPENVTKQELGARALKPRKWDEIPLPEQAGMLCEDEQFQAWMIAQEYVLLDGTENDVLRRHKVIEAVRRECGIKSRSDLNPNTETGQLWIRLDERYRQSCGLIAEEH